MRLNSDEAMIGQRLADDLGVRVGDSISLLTASNRSISVRITAIFEFGIKDLDRRWVYLSLRSAQNLLDLQGQITGIDLQVYTLFNAEIIAQQLQQQYPIKAESWMSSNQQLMTALKSQTASTSLIRFFVLISVAFGIASVLAIAVVQKQKEIGKKQMRFEFEKKVIADSLKVNEEKKITQEKLKQEATIRYSLFFFIILFNKLGCLNKSLNSLIF